MTGKVDQASSFGETKPLNEAPSLLTRLYTSLAHPHYDTPFLLLLLGFETILCQLILRHVPYTEIDWEAYMQQVELWHEGVGELDYRRIRGATGPLVYPAGFLYLFGCLRRVTNRGNDIAAAQTLFCSFYLCFMALVLHLYSRVSRHVVTHNQVPVRPSLSQRHPPPQLQAAHVIWSWRIAMGLCCASKRLHSIFLLRLFNDGPAMLLLFGSVALFAKSYWKLGCVVYSLAVSIKMNSLLFAPGLLLLLLQANSNLRECLLCLAICAVVQLVLGAPFLLTYPESYLRKAFEFDRVFFYKWTVNWKFLSEDAFLSKTLSLVLLTFHLSILVYLAIQWLRSAKAQTGHRLFLGRPLSPDYVIYTLFLSNFVGICFARTLHYQFYSWYCSTIPFLLWRTATYPLLLRVCLVAAMEYAFLVFPATPTSSGVLQLAHGMTLLVSMQSPSAMGMSVAAIDPAVASRSDPAERTKRE